MAARDRIRSFLEANVGKIVTTQEIRDVAGISDYARRIRELRDEEGMQILSHVDRHDLKPGEYILAGLERTPSIERGISPQLRNDILERNGFTCQLCGAGPGDVDPFNPTRKVRLHIDHIIPISQGGTNDRDNLRVLCSACNQGRGNIRTASEGAKNILARIRREPRSVQREVFEALRRQFNIND
mgnify:CR=1 FL=1|jgi:5-methylcytosine-specific restriction endonuclease McrA